MLDEKPQVFTACFFVIMMEQIRFLRDAAEKLRQLAANAPDVADQLRALAAELDLEVWRLEQRSRPLRH